MYNNISNNEFCYDCLREVNKHIDLMFPEFKKKNQKHLNFQNLNALILYLKNSYLYRRYNLRALLNKDINQVYVIEVNIQITMTVLIILVWKRYIAFLELSLILPILSKFQDYEYF